jgi:hypothetical protein
MLFEASASKQQAAGIIISSCVIGVLFDVGSGVAPLKYDKFLIAIAKII